MLLVQLPRLRERLAYTVTNTQRLRRYSRCLQAAYKPKSAASFATKPELVCYSR